MNVLSAKDFDREKIEAVLELAEKYKPVVIEKRAVKDLEGAVMASLFFEPSTRTRLSFETAMKRLGGEVISVSGTESTSISKGETLADTGRAIQQYANVIVMRHPEKGSVQEMAKAVDVPVLNAGDGAGEHPTQALLDLFTIKDECGKIDGLKIVMAGDLKFGRTVHSLAGMLKYFEVEIRLVSSGNLKMPAEVIEAVRANGVEIQEFELLSEAMTGADVTYNTRVQKERFDSLEEYETAKNGCVIDREMIESVSPEIVVMHPLPRNEEIDEDVDGLKGAAYFRQVRNGVMVRMALLKLACKG